MNLSTLYQQASHTNHSNAAIRVDRCQYASNSIVQCDSRRFHVVHNIECIHIVCERDRFDILTERPSQRITQNRQKMARISNYFHLCPINDEEELFGLAPDHSKGTVVNTLGKNIIIIVKVIHPRCQSGFIRSILH